MYGLNFMLFAFILICIALVLVVGGIILYLIRTLISFKHQPSKPLRILPIVFIFVGIAINFIPVIYLFLMDLMRTRL